MSVLANPRLNVTTTSCHEILGISVSPAKGIIKKQKIDATTNWMIVTFFKSTLPANLLIKMISRAIPSALKRVKICPKLKLTPLKSFPVRSIKPIKEKNRPLAKVSFYLIFELAKTLLNVALGCLNFD